MAAVSIAFGEQQPTNNAAELAALIEAMKWMVDHVQDIQGACGAIIYGDSKLIMDFCNRSACPPKQNLFLGMRQV